MATTMVVQSSSTASFIPLVVAESIKDYFAVECTLGQATSLKTKGGETISGTLAIARYLCRVVPKCTVYGNSNLDKAEIDHWLEYSITSINLQCDLEKVKLYLDTVLSCRVFLVGYSLTIGDIAIFSSLRGCRNPQLSGYPNLERWYNFVSQQDIIKTTIAKYPLKLDESPKTHQADVGKFVDLPGAEMGKVVTRFPPEASGYLHIGHAKAALLNQYYQKEFEGKLIMRFDDTNPAKEKVDFEKVILDDVSMLEIKPDLFTFTSDYFDEYIVYAEQLIKDGKAYIDDTPADMMKQQREAKMASLCRSRSVEENLKIWEEMKAGTPNGLKSCLRAAIDPASDNGCMRDPVLYRCKLEAHPRTGNKYKVYPTYDFACPLIDSIEGVTHALRTTEYHDRDPQYYWVLDNLGMRKPYIYEYSRLNLQNTVLSKRKLTWFVNEGIVGGWDDPRFPTVRGVLRRGMTVEGLKKFIAAQGASRAVTMMDWSKLWSFNKKVIDPIAPRHTALLQSAIVPLRLPEAKEGSVIVNKHPKDADVGQKTVWWSSEVLIERVDAETLEEGMTVTLINWGNVVVTSITRNEAGIVTSMEAKLDLDNKDYKSTPKLTWLANTKQSPFIPIVCVHFDHLISKSVLKPEDNFKDYVNYNSKTEYDMLGDPDIALLKKGDIIQLQRKGFYICDEPYRPSSTHSFVTSPCILFSIPDGHTKTTAMPFNQDGGNKEEKTLLTPKKNKADGPAEPQQPAKKHAVITSPPKASSNPSPASNPFTTTNPTPPTTSADVGVVLEQLAKQGEIVRTLKTNNADKPDIDGAVAELLRLKKEYKTLTGEDPPRADGGRKDKKKKASAAVTKEVESGGGPPHASGGKKDKKKSSAAATEKKQNMEVPQEEGTTKKVTRLGLECTKEESLSDWYTQVLKKADLIEYYDVSGCYILRPASYSIWESIKNNFDQWIKELGVENCYFPMFVSRGALQREKDHIQDFAPEVAWVTRSGDTELAEPIALRPTSETVMYPSFAKWIQSHRDLPLKLNQWCNIVRWEFKHPQPFLRTREFLWQEGHTAYAIKADAEKEVRDILDLYRRVYEELLAIPVIPGRKTEKEKFAGGDYTTTIEAYVSASGRGIQAATSHHLGQNFSKMFDIIIEDPDKPGEHMFVYQNSWGLTTRTVGVMIMVHGDNKGLIVPPRIAETQVMVVPCGLTASLSENDRAELLTYCKKFVSDLNEAGIRAKSDMRDQYTSGWKFNNWELKGVPLRVEIGPKEVNKKTFVAVCRDNNNKQIFDVVHAVQSVKQVIGGIQTRLFTKAKNELDSNLAVVDTFHEFCNALDQKKLIMSPYCGEIVCEEIIKKKSAREEAIEPGAPAMGAKALCIPFKQPKELLPGTVCFGPQCGRQAKYYTLFGRSY